MKRPKVSVIIPTYNRASSIGECVESVLKQTMSDYEIIVVDDGSNDHTREALEKYRNRIHYFYHHNRGPSGSRNKGIREAKGEFIAFLDSDDLWAPEKLAKTIPVMETREDIGIVFTNVVFQNAEGNHVRETGYEHLTQGEIRDILTERTLIVTSSAVVRRNVFEEVGVFDERLTYAEDWDLFYRIVRKYRAELVKDDLTIYRFSKNSMVSNSAKREKLIRDTLTVIERIYSYPENTGQVRKKRKFYGRFYSELGEADLVNGDPKWARKWLLTSLNYEPGSRRTYGLLVKSLFWNAGIYRSLRKVKKSLSNVSSVSPVIK